MFEQAREIVRRFNYIYGETLVEPEILLPDNAARLRLPGTDGKLKWVNHSKLYLPFGRTGRNPEEDYEYVYRSGDISVYKTRERLKVTPYYSYFGRFCLPEHFWTLLTGLSNLAELKAHYQRGGLGDVKWKRFLNSIMQEILNRFVIVVKSSAKIFRLSMTCFSKDAK